MPTSYSVIIYQKYSRLAARFEVDNEIDGGMKYGPDPIDKAMAIVESVKADETVLRVVVSKTDLLTFGKIVYNWERK